ncbi:FKBP-type peptidyl-prolyl cis-trans isomerase [Agromyces indicus]|uniref:Peptidyl-prolyl cis-trans isomerase n=1 Tax=Agromyces indicus TaxID=758919 RepID=A0ABU1FKM8_9MICO|nr:FKBP-type peptidyl-prolyl cis-trans isomerase [Agromyces indicus]MDR5692311.1 FKBP-type peptidyl-prolyl cis-trans isomerase [Agromyces indicus]
MRLPLALLATATAVAVTLTGCTAAPDPEATAGASSDLIEVEGDFGQEPRVDFPTPVSPAETQCTEIIEGEGDRLVAGQQALVGLAVYNGTTGEEIDVNGFGDQEPVPILLSEGGLPGIRKGLSCASEGSRVVIVAPPADAFGEEGNAQLGIEPDDSLVMVFDVHRAFLLKANGAPQIARDGFPAVVTAPDGRPGITVPDTEPFESTEVEVLKAGSGAVVEDGDQVVVHYTGVLWDDNSVFDSTWERNGPTAFVVAEGEGSQVVPGFAEALIGQKVGSQVGVVIAPEDGYGDAEQAGIPAGSTLFFVIDILGVV